MPSARDQARAKWITSTCRRALYRRLAFNVLVSNVDDHLRNHGFLWGGREGWRSSPAFDLNPTPVDVRERTLATSIDLEDGTCDLTLVLEVAPFFGLGGREARSLVRGVAPLTPTRAGALAQSACGARCSSVRPTAVRLAKPCQ